MTAPRFIARSEAARLAIGRTPGLDLCRNKAQWHTLLHKRADKAPFVSCGSIRESSHSLEVNDGCHHTIGDLEDRPPVHCREGKETQKRSSSAVGYQVHSAAVFARAILAVEHLQSVIVLGEKRMRGSLLEDYGPARRQGDGADRSPIKRRCPASERVDHARPRSQAARPEGLARCQGTIRVVQLDESRSVRGAVDCVQTGFLVARSEE